MTQASPKPDVAETFPLIRGAWQRLHKAWAEYRCANRRSAAFARFMRHRHNAAMEDALCDQAYEEWAALTKETGDV